MDAFVEHVVDSVATATSHANHLDDAGIVDMLETGELDSSVHSEYVFRFLIHFCLCDYVVSILFFFLIGEYLLQHAAEFLEAFAEALLGLGFLGGLLGGLGFGLGLGLWLGGGLRLLG